MFSGPASGVAGGRVTIWSAGAINAPGREASASQFVKRPRRRVYNVYTNSYDASKSTATSSTVINLRTPPAQRELIERAARLQGKSRTDFMLEASREKAEQVLLEQTLFTVTTKQYKAFIALMEAPLAGNPALKRLLAKRAPWDK